jgi:antitoxin PrlF
MPAPAVLEVESTLTDRYQTTVPETVRRALRLRKRDRIRYVVRPDGAVLLSRADRDDGADPALDAFIGFLAQDIAAHPERVRAIDSGLVQRIRALTAKVEIDLDAPLSPDDE